MFTLFLARYARKEAAEPLSAGANVGPQCWPWNGALDLKEREAGRTFWHEPFLADPDLAVWTILQAGPLGALPELPTRSSRSPVCGFGQHFLHYRPTVAFRASLNNQKQTTNANRPRKSALAIWRPNGLHKRRFAENQLSRRDQNFERTKLV